MRINIHQSFNFEEELARKKKNRSALTRNGAQAWQCAVIKVYKDKRN